MATTKTKKKKPVTDWIVDIQFWGFETRVKARTAGEAKKKAIERAKKRVPSLVNRRNSYASKF